MSVHPHIEVSSDADIFGPLRTMMKAMETAAAADDLAALHRHTREQVRLLEKLRYESDWPAADLMAFLAEAELVYGREA